MKCNLNSEFKRRIARQQAFLKEAKGNLLAFVTYYKENPMAKYRAKNEPDLLSEEFIRKHAYDLGVQRIRSVMAIAHEQIKIGDDSCPSPDWLSFGIEWGDGETVALVTGEDIIFQKGTSYPAAPVISEWEDLDKIHLNLDNRWIQYAIDMCRGMASEYTGGFPITPHLFKSPLDLANSMRGNDLFMDLYTNPEQVERLLNYCTDSIIRIDQFFRQEIPLLKAAPGGVCGVGLPEPGMIFVNGDPVDLISPEMGERFNRPYIERLIEYTGSLYFHHHSIGISRARAISSIKGLTVQEIQQDPNGPRIIDMIDDNLIAASLETPIDLHDLQRYLDIKNKSHLNNILQKLSQGRFILHFVTNTLRESQELVEYIRKFKVI